MSATPTGGAAENDARDTESAGTDAADRRAPGVEVSHLRASYDRRVFSDVSFTVSPGTTTVVSGPSGVGKTTLIRLLLGRRTADRGEIVVGGRSVVGAGRAELAELHRRTGFLFTGLYAGSYGRKGLDYGIDDDPGDGVVASATVGDNIRRALSEHADADRSGSEDDAEERVQRCLQAFDLAEHEHRKARQLGADARRRLGIARVFVTEPTLVLLDDPVASLEPGERDTVIASISRARADRASDPPTIVLACHDLTTTKALGDELVTLVAGRVGVAGPAAELLRLIETDHDFAARFAVGGKRIANESSEALGEHKVGAGLRSFDQRAYIVFLTVLGLFLLLAIVAVVTFGVSH